MLTQTTIGRLGAAQNVAVTTTSAASTAFGTQTRRVLLVATAACNIAIGAPGTTASTSSTLLPANWQMVVVVNPSEVVAAVTASSATLSVTELT
jgi:hypothetical protein